MPFDHVGPRWAIRSALVVVADLDRSVAFYRELGPFEEIVREDAVAMLDDVTPASIVLICVKRGAFRLAGASSRSVSAPLPSTSDRSASWIGSSRYCEAMTSLPTVVPLPTARRTVANLAHSLDV